MRLNPRQFSHREEGLEVGEKFKPGEIIRRNKDKDADPKRGGYAVASSPAPPPPPPPDDPNKKDFDYNPKTPPKSDY